MAGDVPVDVSVRVAAEADWPAVFAIDATVFAMPHDERLLAQERSVLPTERILVSEWGDDGVVATAAYYPFELSLPGATTVAAGGVTNVGVLPTHRRRGLVRALMARQLDDIAADGMPIAILNASEVPIYGRFGYGMATRYSVWHIDVREVSFALTPPERALRFVERADAAGPLAAVYDAASHQRPGTIARTDDWWAMLLGDTESWKGGGPHTVVVAYEGDTPVGYALYRVHHDGPAGRFRVSVRELVAVDDGTRLALWRFVCEIDLAGGVEAEVPLDEPLWWQVHDPRVVRTRETRDFLFVRVLDAAAALSARHYSSPVDLVLEVDDPFRPEGAACGRFRLEGGPDAASCARVVDATEADISMDVTALGSLLLGGVRPGWLAAAGRLHEHRAGALAEATAAFCSELEPFCATRF